jgi:uncharacterized protein (DUF433 family)
MSNSTNGHVAAPALETRPNPSLVPPPGADDLDLDAWKQSLHEHFAPPDALARFLLERIIQTSIDLHRLTRDTPALNRDDVHWIRRVRLLESSFSRALNDWYRHCRFLQQSELHALQVATAQEKKSAAKSSSRKRSSDSTGESEPQPESTPKTVCDPFDKTGDIEIDTATPINWEDHIVYDADVDNRWPIIRGTKHTAEGIAAGMIYGWSFRHMLAYYPGITVDDIRAVITCEKVGMCGPWPDGRRPEPHPLPEGSIASRGVAPLADADSVPPA